VARATAPARSNTTKSKTPPSTPSKPDPGPGCDESTHYVNSDGTCVHRPTSAPSAPSGASARCNDSTYSYSKHRQGTCSGHHGVAQWL
jgi:hypothetical protein